MARETELQMVQRHIRDGAAAMARQRALVARLEGRGCETLLAGRLLEIFEQIQAAHVAHLARITDQPSSE